MGGTSAVSHLAGSLVRMNVVAEHFEALQDGTAFAVGGIGASPYADGWTPLLGVTPDTVTYNGNRNYDLVFNSTDLTDQLSPGMKLQLTRTVAAPDMCADLKASSSQYFSKSSPNGMSFTDDFVVSAWIKLESYVQCSIASRYNGTSGWDFGLDSAGRISLSGFNASGSNQSGVASYQAIPLNKWVHVAVQLDMSAYTATSATSYVMIDGQDVPAFVYRSGTNPTAIIQAGNLEIGSRNGGTIPFDGKIAQVAIYSAKVTQANMRLTMSQGLSGSETFLVSAYSLDNTLNDLNTTNANNLTANGGAAATATDSPFANAVAKGLLEYAEINSVAFSTNTTVNVRVPDTCMIPTSGGVSAVSYSTQSNPYGLPYFSKIIGYAQIMSNFTTSSATDTQVLGLTCPVVVPTGARVKVTFFASNIANATTTTIATATIYNGTPGSGTKLDEILSPMVSGIGNMGNSVYMTYTPTSGSNTFNAGIRTTGGTVTVAGATTTPSYLQVELV